MKTKQAENSTFNLFIPLKRAQSEINMLMLIIEISVTDSGIFILMSGNYL